MKINKKVYLYFILLSLIVLIVSCRTVLVTRTSIIQIVTEPPVFLLDRPLTFRNGSYNQYKIEVPRGFVTDLASIPKFLWWWKSPHEATLLPAIIHDFLYWQQPCSKDESDAVMYLAMRQVGMSEYNANKIYLGIRTPFAQNAWEKNIKDKANGEIRYFSESYTTRLATEEVKPHQTLKDIQTDAQYQDSNHRPVFPAEDIKKACEEALKEYTEMKNNNI